MVIDEQYRASRASTLKLIGGALALDFANTSSGRGSDAHVDHLRTAADVVDWARHAQVLSDEEAAGLAFETAISEVALLDAALALREDIHIIGVAISAGLLAPARHVSDLARAHANALTQATLSRIDQRFVWRWSVEYTPIEAVLGPISLSALTILQQTDLTRIKQCQGDKCGWLFLDTTKNKSRRWCEMEICGNRAKQKRFSAKARGS